MCLSVFLCILQWHSNSDQALDGSSLPSAQSTPPIRMVRRWRSSSPAAMRRASAPCVPLAGVTALLIVALASFVPHGAAVAAPSAAAISREWSVYNVQRASMRVNGALLSDSLRGPLDWTFTTPLASALSSNVYTGSGARMRRVVHALSRGDAVKIVAIGGAATNGSDASRPGEDDYFSLYVNYLKRAFPAARVESVRSAAGLAPSAVVAQCLSAYLPADADLVLLQMVTNDALDESIVSGANAPAYEHLMRGVLMAQNKPALVLTQVRCGRLHAGAVVSSYVHACMCSQ
jgi:hypothetical protein